MEIAKYIDHTFLKPAGEKDAVRKLCREAKKAGFASVCVNPCEVELAARLLKGSDVRVCTVIGFPLGQDSTLVKCFAATDAVNRGAQELDFVVNQRLLKFDPDACLDELKSIVRTCRLMPEIVSRPVPLTKLILECCNLTKDEIVLGCRLAKKAGFDFVKTSTGFGTGGATVEDVKLMRKTVGKKTGVKAAGGIRDRETALKMIAAGATRIGASAGLKLTRALLVAAACAASAAFGGSSCDGISVRLKGPVGDALDRMIENHLAATDVDYLTAPFAAHNERNWLWRTEFWGKFMHAAEPLQRYSGDPKLRAVIDRGLASILACQEKSGYIGNYPDELRCGKGWDIWGMKYTLMGLMHNFDGTGNAKSLEAAKRLLDYAVAEIGRNGRRGRPLATTGHCAGQPSLSILEPVMWMYNRTKEKRYLAFADYIVEQMDDPKVGPELIRLALADVPVWRRNDPKSEKLVWIHQCNRLKAYEMMSCYQGLLEYYEVTGRKDCLAAAVKSAESIVRDEVNLAGGSCSSEHWFHGAIHQHEPYVHLQETCVTITWMRLLEKLVRLTGDPKWSDQFERTFFNAYLGSLRPDGGEFAAYTPLSGYRWHGHHHCRMHANCCDANGPRGFLAFLRTAARADGDALVLDQYASGIVEAKLANGAKAGFDVYTLYPFEGWMRLTSRTAGAYGLRLRIPAWSAKTRVKVNGEELKDVRCGSYCTVDRTWAVGDAVEVSFDMRVVAHVVDHHVAFTRGPVLLARDSRFGEGDLAEVIRDPIRDGQEMSGSQVVRSPSGAFRMTVTVPLGLGSHSENPEGVRSSQVKFCDYWSAGGEWDPANGYRTWFPLERRPWED